jgi:hypothetical protein
MVRSSTEEQGAIRVNILTLGDIMLTRFVISRLRFNGPDVELSEAASMDSGDDFSFHLAKFVGRNGKTNAYSNSRDRAGGLEKTIPKRDGALTVTLTEEALCTQRA